MTHNPAPRVLYCASEDPFFKKLSRHAEDFVLEARSTNFSGSPQKLARSKRASALVLRIKGDLDLKHQEWLSRNDASTPVIVICQNGTVETAVHILQYGVFDYFSASQNLAIIAKRIQEAVAWKAGKAWKREADSRPGLLHGKNPQIEKINQQARQLARESSKPVLLYGEPGTGKEHLAYGMYRLCAGGDIPFIRYDCRLLQQISRYDGVSVSRLVHTGLQETSRRHRDGVLFLNHMEQLHADQRQDILEESDRFPIRLIASCQEPDTAEQEKISAIPTLRIPALRQHSDDIPVLAEYFIRKTAKDRRMKPKSISRDMVALMQGYAWPGNVQELSNVLDRMMMIEPSGMSTANTWNISQGYGFHLKLDQANRFTTLIEELLKTAHANRKSGMLYDDFMEKMKRMLIDLVLPKVDYNQATAARMLGISRNTLREIIRQTNP